MSDQTMTPEHAARVLARYPHTYITGHGADVFSELFRTARHYQERALAAEEDVKQRDSTALYLKGFVTAENKKATAAKADVARLTKHIEWMGEREEKAEAQVAALTARLDESERARDTYAVAARERCEERNEARQEAAELRAEVERLQQECRDRADCEQSLTRMLLEVQEDHYATKCTLGIIRSERDTATLMLEAVRHRAEQDGLQPILDVLDRKPMPGPVPGYVAVPVLAIDPEAEARVDEWCAENEPKRTGRKL